MNDIHRVSIYVFENYKNNARSFEIHLEGELADTVAGMARGEWKAYTSDVVVTDGELTIDLVSISSDAHIMGLEIFKYGLFKNFR